MKRIVDLLIILIIGVPVILLIIILSILIIIINRYSPWYFQERIGKDEKIFVCCKLQTMKPSKDLDYICDFKKDAKRVTRFGLFLRNHGWDEIPQILNILIGEMSFIGPRPLPIQSYNLIEKENPELLGEIESWKKLRSSVLPGLSGWHQINYTAGASMITCDLTYFNSPSKKRIIKIFLSSIIIFIMGKKWHAKHFH